MTSSAHLQGFFNWSLSYRTDATFPVPYGEVRATRGHPSGERLHKIIRDFGLVSSYFDVHQYSQYIHDRRKHLLALLRLKIFYTIF